MDLLADFCNRINLSSRSKRKSVIVKNSKLVIMCLKKLKSLGYIINYIVLDYKYIKVFLRYSSTGDSVIRNLSVVRKFTNKTGITKKQIKANIYANSLNYNGFVLFSTSKIKSSIATDIECVMLRTGGLPLCEVI